MPKKQKLPAMWVSLRWKQDRRGRGGRWSWTPRRPSGENFYEQHHDDIKHWIGTVSEKLNTKTAVWGDFFWAASNWEAEHLKTTDLISSKRRLTLTVHLNENGRCWWWLWEMPYPPRHQSAEQHGDEEAEGVAGHDEGAGGASGIGVGWFDIYVFNISFERPEKFL